MGESLLILRENILRVDCKIWQILERRKTGSTLGKKRVVCLNLPFLKKKKPKKTPTFFHEAFFFKSICPWAFFPTYPCLSFKTNIYSFLLWSVRKFLWGYALQTYPGSNCHLLPMAQQMTNSTAGRWAQGGDCVMGAVHVLPMGQFLKGKKHRTVFSCANKILGPWPSGKCVSAGGCWVGIWWFTLGNICVIYHMMLLAYNMTA